MQIIPLKPQELSAAQLCWLREKVASFGEAHDAAERAQIHAAKVREDTFNKSRAA
jgi:hypothetical protein